MEGEQLWRSTNANFHCVRVSTQDCRNMHRQSSETMATRHDKAGRLIGLKALILLCLFCIGVYSARVLGGEASTKIAEDCGVFNEFKPMVALVAEGEGKLHHGELFRMAQTAQSEGQYDLALLHIRRALEVKPLAIYYNALGEIGRASGMLAKVVMAFESFINASTSGSIPEAHYNLATILREIPGRDHPENLPAANFPISLEKAVYHFDLAINLWRMQSAPGTVVGSALYERGLVLQELGQLQSALSSFTDSMDASPYFLEAYASAWNLYQLVGDKANAIGVMKRAGLAFPLDARIFHNLGSLLHGEQDEEAERSYKRAIQVEPDCVASLASLGSLAGDRGLQSQADYFFALALNAAFTPALGVKCNPLVGHRRIPGTSDSEEHIQKADKAMRDATVLMRAISVLPRIYQSNEQIREARDRFRKNLEKILAGPPLYIPEPRETIGSGSLGYYLIYQGFHDRYFREKLAQIYRKASPHLSYTAQHVTSRDFTDVSSRGLEVTECCTRRRIKVGFVSAYFYHHSVGLLLQGVVSRLSRDLFDVYVFLFPQPEDEVTARIRQDASEVVDIPRDDTERAQDLIAARQLDIVIFSEIGMDPATYFLAFSRLAPVQAVFWGHAVTSGIDSIDYFISSTDFQTPDAQANYSEKVYWMPGGLTTYFLPPTRPQHTMSRKDFGLSEGKTLYMVPQTLYKLHPDFDELVDKVLLLQPEAHIAFIDGQRPEWQKQLLQRFKRTLCTASLERVHFVRRLRKDEFMAFIDLADVVLDPFPVGGGRSSFEVFSVSKPVVILYPRTSILQLTYAMYKKMGIVDTIAYSPEQYVQIAVRLGRDAEWREMISQRIAMRKHLLYEDEGVVRQWERFIIDVTGSSERRSPAERGRGEHTCSALHHIDPLSLSPTTRGTWSLSKSEASGSKGSESEPSRPMRPTVSISIASDDGLPTEILTIGPEDDPDSLAKNFFTSKNVVFDCIKYRFVSRVLQNAVFRYDKPIFGIFNIFLPNYNDILSVEVRKGDDLGLLSKLEASKYKLDDDDFRSLLIKLHRLIPIYKDPEWVSEREDRVSAQKAVHGPQPLPIKQGLPACVTLAMTTCKRMSLFKRTIKSVVDRVRLADGGLICDIVVIDDNSREEDRLEMLNLLPQATFVFKAPRQKGHAVSMNMLLDLVESEFLLYLEDDWEALNFEESTVAAAVDILTEHRHPRGVLQEGLVQVLLNKQDSGWPRSLRRKNDEDTSYWIHEFGVVEPSHHFSFWPGFSLNPAVWDMSVMRTLGLRFNETSPIFEREFSLAVHDTGFKIAYLNSTNFVHIGAEPGQGLTAYVLNGMPRAWDMVESPELADP